MGKWLAIGMVLALTGCGADAKAGTFNSSAFFGEIRNEPKVKDALLTESGNIYIGMLDNGSNRDSYAMYVCEVARDYAEGDVGRKLVKIIDIAAVARGDGFQELGKYWCEF